MESAKFKIIKCFKKYKQLFAEEYNRFLRQPKQENFSSKSDVIKEKIAEYPDSLYLFILKELNEEEMKWFGTKPGIMWLIKSFPEFSVKNKVKKTKKIKK